MVEKSKVIEEIKRLKGVILKAEKENRKISETDTRQGLINNLFRVLGWDFSDFDHVKSEFPHNGEFIDYAFFSTGVHTKPIMLLEAKSLGTNLEQPKVVKQLCSYLGSIGTQWGVLSDGNTYSIYNSSGGLSFEEQRFITFHIKTVDTDDGISSTKLAERMINLLSRQNLESEKIQQEWYEQMVNSQLERALTSLLSEPFDTLVKAIKSEFKEGRVKANPNLKIPKKAIEEYLRNISDEGIIPLDIGNLNLQGEKQTIESIEGTPADKGEQVQASQGTPKRTKRVSILDLLNEGIVAEGDSWKLEYKGEVFWARITGNGELEVNGKTYSNPSKAGNEIIVGACSGWNWWQFKDTDNAWKSINDLRDKYKEKYGLK